jgi:outer membrane protein assembly factor BamB
MAFEAVIQTHAATWPFAGQNRNNTRANENERLITPANVSRLSVKWQFTTAGDVSATPAVDNKSIYFPDWGGNLHALKRETGFGIYGRVRFHLPSYPCDLWEHARNWNQLDSARLLKRGPTDLLN